jgi:hypothetical protein
MRKVYETNILLSSASRDQTALKKNGPTVLPVNGISTGTSTIRLLRVAFFKELYNTKNILVKI